MNKLRFITAFAVGSEQEKTAMEKLIPSLEAFSLPYHLFADNDPAKKLMIGQYKAMYIQRAMSEYPGENIVWLDPVATIIHYPTLLFHIPEYCHLGVSYLDLKDHYGRSNDKNTVAMVDCVSYFKNCPYMLKVLNEWLSESSLNAISSTRILRRIIDQKIEEDINVFILPRQYVYISKRMDGSSPANPIEAPVISITKAKLL